MPESLDPATHRRWAARLPLHRNSADANYLRSWYDEQCGGCSFYRPLVGTLGADWGACLNAASPCDGTIRFEHDGCEAFTYDDSGEAPFA